MLLKSYKQLIDKLVSKKYSPTLDNYYLSLYLNVENKSRSDIQTMINSWLQKGFERRDELGEKNDLRHKVQKEVLQQFRAITSFDRGLALFASFSKDNNEFDVNIAHLNNAPEDDVFVGKVYNLDQLIWTYNKNRELLILDMDKFNFDIYHLTGEKLEKIGEFDNEFFETTDKEYQESFTPVEGKSKIVYGKGERKTERRKERSLKHFFEWSFNNLLDEDFFKEFDLRYLFVFHTSLYEEISEEMKEYIKQKIKLEPIMISRINTESANLRKVIKREINKIKKEKKEELLKKARSAPQRYVKGWKDVTDEARFAKIDTLFLKPKVKKQGYLTNPKMIYTYPVKGSQKIDNIEPWLVLDTYNKGGEIRIIDREDEILKSDISALLRY